MSLRRPFVQYFSTNGDGTGTINAVGNYAAAATEFKLAPPAGERYEVGCVLITIKDSGSLDADLYGNGVALTNGIDFHLEENGVNILDLFAGQTVKTNANWASHTFEYSVITHGSGDNFIIAKWKVCEALGEALSLDGDDNEELILTLNDNFTGLTGHTFLAHGRRVIK